MSYTHLLHQILHMSVCCCDGICLSVKRMKHGLMSKFCCLRISLPLTSSFFLAAAASAADGAGGAGGGGACGAGHMSCAEKTKKKVTASQYAKNRLQPAAAAGAFMDKKGGE